MKTIWKYPVKFPVVGCLDNFTLEFTILMPEEAIFRYVGIKEKEDVCIWMEVDTDNPKENRTFRFFATGEDLDLNELMKYCGSIIFSEAQLVFHLYEILSVTYC